MDIEYGILLEASFKNRILLKASFKNGINLVEGFLQEYNSHNIHLDLSL
jgi:hypothetical protein